MSAWDSSSANNRFFCRSHVKCRSGEPAHVATRTSKQRVRSSVRGLATSHQEAQQVEGVRLFQHSDVFELEYLVSLADQRKLW